MFLLNQKKRCLLLFELLKSISDIHLGSLFKSGITIPQDKWS